MYLDPELQVILTAPVEGVPEDIVLLHPPGARDEVLSWLHNEDIQVKAKELPYQMLAVTLDQGDLLYVFQQDLLLGAARDDGLGTLRLQTWWDTKLAAARAAHLADATQCQR